MTTIAYRDGILAADGLWNNSGTRMQADKLFRLNNGLLMGGAGNMVDILAFRAWLDQWGERVGEPEFKIYSSSGQDMPSFDAIVIDAEGLVWTWDQYLQPHQINEPFYAIGSGRQAAMGAMYCGASAHTAVEAAISIDVHSGFPIMIEQHLHP